MASRQMTMEMLLRDRGARWCTAAGVGVVWLTAAWGEPVVLALLAVPAAIWWLLQRRPAPDESELTDLL
jgi:hypothetical protein